MRYRRNMKHLQGQLDAAPFAAVFFILLIFAALSRNLVFTPGAPIRLPEAGDLVGTGNPTVAVAVDAAGDLYYDNQVISDAGLRERLQAEVRRSREPLTLVIQADRDVRHERLSQLALLARDAGIKDALLATRPKLAEQLQTPAKPAP